MEVRRFDKLPAITTHNGYQGLRYGSTLPMVIHGRRQERLKAPNRIEATCECAVQDEGTWPLGVSRPLSSAEPVSFKRRSESLAQGPFLFFLSKSDLSVCRPGGSVTTSYCHLFNLSLARPPLATCSRVLTNGLYELCEGPCWLLRSALAEGPF